MSEVGQFDKVIQEWELQQDDTLEALETGFGAAVVDPDLSSQGDFQAQYTQLLTKAQQDFATILSPSQLYTPAHIVYNTIYKLRLHIPPEARQGRWDGREYLVSTEGGGGGISEGETTHQLHTIQRLLREHGNTITLYLGTSRTNRRNNYHVPAQYLAEIQSVNAAVDSDGEPIKVPGTNTYYSRLRLKSPFRPTADDMTFINFYRDHLAEAGIGMNDDEILARSLGSQGRAARIHFDPDQSDDVMRYTIQYLSPIIDTLNSGLDWLSETTEEWLGTNLGTIACCLIQVLASYEAQRRSGMLEDIKNLTSDINDFVLIIEAYARLLSRLQRMPYIDNIMGLLINPAKVILFAVAMGTFSIITVVLRQVVIGWAKYIKDWYFDRLEAMSTSDRDIARCFNLEYLLVRMLKASLYGKVGMMHWLGIVTSYFTRKIKALWGDTAAPQKTERALLMNTAFGDFIHLMQTVTNPQIIADILRKIQLAVERGELCFNQGYSDIPIPGDVSSDNGDGLGGIGDGSDDDQADSSVLPRIDIREQDVLPILPGGPGDYSGDFIADQLVHEEGGGGGSGTNYPSSSSPTPLTASSAPASSGSGSAGSGISGTGTGNRIINGPTDSEMVNFFQKYFNMSFTDAQNTMESSRGGRCIEKLTPEQAGQLAAVLAQIGLEL